MKKSFLLCAFALCFGIVHAQNTFYWVGGAGLTSFTSNSNWNEALDGSGNTRTAAAPTDVLIFDGSNIGGAVPATGNVTVSVTSTNFSQLAFINNANVTFQRPVGGGGTATLTVNGNIGVDFFIQSGSSLAINSSAVDGNVQFTFNASATGIVNGAYTMMNSGAHRMNLPTPGQLVFTNGSSFTSNITSGSASYPFGSNSQSVAKAVMFENGANLYYNGGYSPMGNNSAFMAIDMQTGSNWYHRATNPLTGSGSFFNTKSFGNIIVENNATLASDGPVYRIGNLTVRSGSAFNTHTSGQTAVLGDMTIEGSYSAPSGSNVLVLGGNALQTISGAGTISTPGLVVGDNASVKLNKNIAVLTSANVFGKLDFGTSALTGAGTFTAKAADNATPVTGTLVAGNYQVTGVVGTMASINGLTILGTGIEAGTTVVGFSSGGATINLSKPINASGTLIALSFQSDTATLATASTSGFAEGTGSVQLSGTATYQSGIHYTINAPTTTPFGVSTGSVNTFINTGILTVNVPITVNKKVRIISYLYLSDMVRLNPLDTMHFLSGSQIIGAYGPSGYIVMGSDAVNGEQSVVQYDDVNSLTTIPMGTPANYLPVTLNPVTSSSFVITVFEGITSNGLINGSPLSPAQKQSVVNAVWNIDRINGAGDAGLILGWTTALEGSTFTSLPDSDIGIIYNNGSSYSLPTGTGDNTTNTATTTVSVFGAYAVGAVPPSQPFVFNPLPVKIYGDPDFNGGATSLNTTQPIVYTSSDPLVATIAGDNIHIVNSGTVTITASQASDGFYPAASISQLLLISKAELEIAADTLTRFEGVANPPLTATYTGFVAGESASVLLTPAVLNTTALISSAPGVYPITIGGATATNYNITFVDATLTVQPKQNQVITFNALPVKTYGNANFATGATSTNNTIPITYSSSNTNVATIVGNNIHIVGAGTSNITASQAGNGGYFPAPNVTRTLTVNKANLNVRVRDTSRLYNEPNPPFTISYTGFVLGESITNLLTQVVAITPAIQSSAPGYYPITVGGGTSNNYNFLYTNGRLTVLPVSGTANNYINAFMSNSSTLTVRVYSPVPALGDIRVYDINGRPMLRRNLFMPSGFINMDIPVGVLTSGIYIVTVKGNGVDLRQTIRIIK